MMKKHFDIVDNMVRENKMLYKMKHKTSRFVKWLSFEWLSKQKQGLEMIQDYEKKKNENDQQQTVYQQQYQQQQIQNQDSDSSASSLIRARPVSCYSIENGDKIKSFELIGCIDQEGSAMLLKVHPRQWVFKVQWQMRKEKKPKFENDQYYTYEQLMEYDAQKIIEMWEGTFKEKPYCDFFSQLMKDND